MDEDRRITFRVGFNLEDIIIDGEGIHGDGVNIAARLQEIAMPGTIAISHRGYEDIRARLDATFQEAGEQTLRKYCSACGSLAVVVHRDRYWP